MGEWVIAMALSVIFECLKDPALKEKFKRGLIKLAKGVDATFPGEVCPIYTDPEPPEFEQGGEGPG